MIARCPFGAMPSEWSPAVLVKGVVKARIDAIVRYLAGIQERGV